MNDHVVLTINGLVVYESSIGTKPPTPAPTPVPTPVPTPTPPRSTINYGLYMGETRAIATQLGRDKIPGWSWEEFEASGFMEPDGIFTAAPVADNMIRPSNTPYRVDLVEGVESPFVVPTYPGEQVTLILLEVAGTPDTLQTNSYVTDERGRVLAGPSYFGRHGSHTFTAQGSRCILSVTPTDSGPLGIQRR